MTQGNLVLALFQEMTWEVEVWAMQLLPTEQGQGKKALSLLQDHQWHYQANKSRKQREREPVLSISLTDDFENIEIGAKSQFFLTILVHPGGESATKTFLRTI